MRQSSFEGLARHYRYNKDNFSSPPKFSFWSGFLILFFVVLVLVLIASSTGFLIFGRQVIELKNEGVVLEIKGPIKVTAGQKEVFLVRVKNKERVALEAADLKLNLPQAFYLENSSELCSERFVSGCVWNLGKLLRTQEKTIEFEGYFLAPSEKEQERFKFEASLNFRMAGFTANFKKNIEKKVEVLPVLFFDLILPSKASVGQEISGEIIVENKGERDIENIRIDFKFLPDFRFVSLEKIEGVNDLGFEKEGMRAWQLNGLRAKEKKNIPFRGIFNDEGNKIFNIVIALIGPDKRLFKQQEEQKEVLVGESNFKLQFLGAEEVSLWWGKEFTLSFGYQNNSDQELDDVFFKLTFDQPELIDWQKTLKEDWQWQSGEKKISANFWQISEESGSKILTWRDSQISALKKISPGEKGEIRFNLKIIDLTEAVKNTSPNFEISLEASGSWQEEVRAFFRTTPCQIKIKTE